ncbi:aminoglycoside phosphotransferase [Deinococcus aerolatus]|uniref:Aminoglycoside phosphotransferase n=1 Tax=Deinococcus aerolatus TaxID=522487 RepID=A0ABQ2G5J0_9DEIO|nr:phosphotransferase [Deinococcus aerolatus]GGL76624.1 aminoglycoside phosphotransferase [Deinococcus aerolatus]
MTLRPTPPGTPRPQRFPELEARYGALTPMDSGMQSRVYTTPDGAAVVKIYRNHKGQHRTEARNMVQAGMGEWLLGVTEADGVEVLIMRRFAGHPLRAADVPRALPRLQEIVARLHTQQQGRVNLAKVRERLMRFRRALAAYPLPDLFDAVELPLERGLLDQPAAFCHLDMWHDNILIAGSPVPDRGRAGAAEENGGGSEVLLIDWTRADWDDPLRDLALLKTGTLDLLGAAHSLEAALSFLPDHTPATLTRYRAYLALTTLHDLYWFLMNEPYEFDTQKEFKVARARHALARLPEIG